MSDFEEIDIVILIALSFHDICFMRNGSGQIDDIVISSVIKPNQYTKNEIYESVMRLVELGYAYEKRKNLYVISEIGRLFINKVNR